MGLSEESENRISQAAGDRISQAAESAELKALAAKAHLEHLRDSLLDKAKQLEVQEQFSVRGDQSQVKPKLTNEIRGQIAEVFRAIGKASGDRGE